MKTMKPTSATVKTAKKMISSGLVAPVRACSRVWPMMVGKRATMPAKMISEMPLPTPRLVICSPIHISSMVPPVSVITAPMRKNKPGWIDDMACRRMLKADGDAISLDHGQRHGEVAGVLVDDLAARLAFLLQRFQFGKHRRHQLDDDGGGDVGHDAEGEDRHAADRAAGQGVEDVEQAAALTAASAAPAPPDRCRAWGYRCRGAPRSARPG